MTDQEENPLKKLEISRNEVDLEQLYAGLENRIQIVQENGEPRPEDDYYKSSNKEKFVSLLLYRRAAFELGHLDEDEIGAESGWFTKQVDVDESRIRHYAGNLAFVENDSSNGGYHIPGYDIQKTNKFLKE